MFFFVLFQNDLIGQINFVYVNQVVSHNHVDNESNAILNDCFWKSHRLKSRLALKGATIQVFDAFGDLKTEGTTTTDGTYQVIVPCGAAYRFVASKPNYSTQEKPVSVGTTNFR